MSIESIPELQSVAAGEGGAPQAGWRPQAVLEGVTTAGLTGNLLFVETSASAIQATSGSCAHPCCCRHDSAGMLLPGKFCPQLVTSMFLLQPLEQKVCHAHFVLSAGLAETTFLRISTEACGWTLPSHVFEKFTSFCHRFACTLSGTATCVTADVQLPCAAAAQAAAPQAPSPSRPPGQHLP